MKSKKAFFNKDQDDKPGKGLSPKDFSAFMKKQERLEKEKLKAEAEAEEETDSVEETAAPIVSAKTTKLVFLRQYNTYQALLEILPKNGLKVDDCFSKAILYIMQWFRKRLGEDIFEEYPAIDFLKDNYPAPEKYSEFHIENTENIEGLNFLDLKTFYMPSKKGWLFLLSELDNGQERKDIQGRSFKTEISLYRQENSVVLGIRETCKEPKENKEDAFGYRPGFVRDMFLDQDLLVTEQGLDSEYAFTNKPIMVNGKSGENCEKIYKDLIASEYRQMPILFVPGEFYDKHAEEVDYKTISLLGYCHVVVCQNTCKKLFALNMQNEEFADVAEEGQLIFYRTNTLQEYPTDYYEESEEENVLDQIKFTAQREPIRKQCVFREFSFEPVMERTENDDEQSDKESNETIQAYKIAALNQEVGDLKRDNDVLQRKNDSLKLENDKLDKDIALCMAENLKNNNTITDLESTVKSLKNDKTALKAQLLSAEMNMRALKSSEKERYTPLMNLPAFGKDKKDGIIDWIKTYYSDVLEVHPNAVKSLADDPRNIDWHRLCMMIHYLAGYTRYRNEGGVALDPSAARDYDPEEAAYTVTPASGGTLGAAEFHKDKYTIGITDSKGETQDAILDLHIKYGKGSDVNMIRIYFCYSPELEKSVIGYMPGHLPTRKSAH